MRPHCSRCCPDGAAALDGFGVYLLIGGMWTAGLHHAGLLAGAGFLTYVGTAVFFPGSCAWWAAQLLATFLVK